jgi:hypothetical protein
MLSAGILAACAAGCSAVDDDAAPADAGTGDALAASAADVPGVGRDPGNVSGADAASTAVDVKTSDAGSSGDAGGLAPLVTVPQACGMWADTYCARLSTCAAFRLEAEFTSANTCRERLRTACVNEAAAPGSGLIAFSLVRCSQQLPALGCVDLLAGQLPDTCRPAGMRPVGMECAVDTQCASGHCGVERDEDGCGTCEGRGARGAPCERDGACLSGLTCHEGFCTEPAGESASCAKQPCLPHLACVEGKCVKPRAAGEACEASRECNLLSGELCAAKNASSGARVCRAVRLAGANEVCATAGGDIVAICSGGLDLCLADATGAGRCAVAAKDGAPCDEDAPCLAGARCVAGTCTLSTPVCR